MSITSPKSCPWKASAQFEKLMKEKSVVIESPKIRWQLYSLLKEQGIAWKSEIISCDEGKRCMCRWSGGRTGWWTVPRVVRLIEHGRIKPEDLAEACNRFYSFDDISEIFSDKLSFTEKISLINRCWGEQLENDKWTPFDSCRVRKTTVRISLKGDHSVLLASPEGLPRP